MAHFTPTGRSRGDIVNARGPLGSWNFDPYDVFANFSSGLAPLQLHGVEVHRVDNGYNVELPVAGYAPDQIEVTYKDDAITISGKSARGSFTRQFELPDTIDPEQTTARVEHGLLTITLRHHPEESPRKIKVEVGH